MHPMEWDRKLLQRNIPDEIRTEAIDYARRNQGIFAPQGRDSGGETQRIISHIGYLMTRDLFCLGVENLCCNPDRPIEEVIDLFNFQLGGETYDVRSTGSTEYRDKGTIWDSWDILIPESQWEKIQHDYYIRIVLDSLQAVHVRKCGWLCACVKKAVSWAKVDNTGPQPMRVVPAKWTFPVRRILPHGIEV